MPDECAECGVSLGAPGGRPTSSFDETLCVVCGLETVDPRGQS